jgi:dihydroorotate dehydrogenase (fumarate)
MPIIGSLNGTTPEGWTEYAKEIEQAGASALELNIFYVPTDISRTGEEVEKRYLEVLQKVKKSVTIPVAVKLSPYFTSMGHMASKLSEAGADGLVLFNRFYEPDIDIDHLNLENTLELSHPSEARLPLMWIGILYDQLPLSLAATTGVHSGRDLIKYLLAGADVAMTTSALLKHGIGIIPSMLEELERWMELRGFKNLAEMRGVMSRKHVREPAAYARANYIKVLQGYEV